MKGPSNSLTYLLFFSCLSAIVSSAQSASTTTAAALTAQVYQAFSDGKPIATVNMSGTASWQYGSDQQSGDVQLIANVDGSSRVEMHLDKGTRIETQSAFNASPHCAWRGFDGAQHESPLHNCFVSAVWFLPQITLQRGVAQFAMAQVADENHLWQARAPKPKVSNALERIEKISMSDLELDSATGLVRSLTFNIHPDDDAGADIPVESRYSAYRQIAGATLPFKIQSMSITYWCLKLTSILRS